MLDFTTAHAEVVAATRSGFAFLFSNGLGWLAVGVVALRWSVVRTALRERGFALGPFFVGAALLIGALLVY